MGLTANCLRLEPPPVKGSTSGHSAEGELSSHDVASLASVPDRQRREAARHNGIKRVNGRKATGAE
jgi:hypothetical protein